MPLIRGRDLEQFSESKSPPYRGSHLPHAHPSSFEMRRQFRPAVPATGANLMSPEVAEPVG
jgi:hypothetical protein